MSGDKLQVEFLAVSNTAQTQVRHTKGSRELVMIINPASNSNNVAVAVDGAASLTATANLGPVLSPSQSFVFPLGKDNTDLNALAATGSTTVVVLRQSFRPG